MNDVLEKLNFKRIVMFDDEVVINYRKDVSDNTIESIYKKIDYPSYSLTGDFEIDKTHNFNENLHNQLLRDNDTYKKIYTELYYKSNVGYQKIKSLFTENEILLFDNIEKILEDSNLSTSDFNLFFIDDYFFNESKGNDYFTELKTSFSKSYFIILTTNENFKYTSDNSIMCNKSFIIKSESEEIYLQKLLEIIKRQSLFNFTAKISELYDNSLQITKDFFLELSSKIDYFSDYIFKYLDVEDSSFSLILLQLFNNKLNLEVNKYIYEDSDIWGWVIRQYIAWKNKKECDIVNEELKQKLFEIQNFGIVDYNINKSFSSIGLGDIFEINSLLYISIQECDMSLRYDRKKEETCRNLSSALLILLEKVNNVKKNGSCDIRININNQEYSPSFKNYLSFDLSILDLTSYNNDGKAIFDSTIVLKDSMEARFGKKRLLRFEDIGKQMDKFFILKQNNDIFNEFKGQYYIENISNNIITFDVRRICRISKLISNKISISFAHDISRIGEMKNMYSLFHYQVVIDNEFVNATNLIDAYGSIFDTHEENKDVVKKLFSDKKHVPIECITIPKEKHKEIIRIDLKKLLKISKNKIKVDISMKEIIEGILSLDDSLDEETKIILFDEQNQLKKSIEIDLKKIKNNSFDLINAQGDVIAKLNLKVSLCEEKPKISCYFHKII